MISVVIPLWNQSATISRAIGSVLAQSHGQWELVIVDDGSTDDPATVVARFPDPRIRLVRQANQGVSAARNRGVQEARGEVIAFLDADDAWEPGHLADLAALVKKYPSAGAYATAYYMIHTDGRRLQVRTDLKGARQGLVEDYFAAAHEASPPLHSSSVAARKVDLIRLGGFPVGLGSGEDLVTWARLACLGPIAYCNEPTGCYYAPPITTRERVKVLRRPPQPDIVGEELLRLAGQGPSAAASRSRHRYRGSWHRIRAMMFLELNERRSCLEEVRRAMAADRARSKDLVLLSLLLFPSRLRASFLEAVRERKLRKACAAPRP